MLCICPHLLFCGPIGLRSPSWTRHVDSHEAVIPGPKTVTMSARSSALWIPSHPITSAGIEQPIAGLRFADLLRPHFPDTRPRCNKASTFQSLLDGYDTYIYVRSFLRLMRHICTHAHTYPSGHVCPTHRTGNKSLSNRLNKNMSLIGSKHGPRFYIRHELVSSQAGCIVSFLP